MWHNINGGNHMKPIREFKKLSGKTVGDNYIPPKGCMDNRELMNTYNNAGMFPKKNCLLTCRWCIHLSMYFQSVFSFEERIGQKGFSIYRIDIFLHLH